MTTALDVDRLNGRLYRYRVQRFDLLALTPTGAKDAGDIALRVSYLDGKIDLIEDILDEA